MRWFHVFAQKWWKKMSMCKRGLKHAQIFFFVKINVLLKKLLKSWFHGKLLISVKSMHSVLKWKMYAHCTHRKNFRQINASIIHLVKKFALTKSLKTNCDLISRNVFDWNFSIKMTDLFYTKSHHKWFHELFFKWQCHSLFCACDIYNYISSQMCGPALTSKHNFSRKPI